MEYIIKHAHRDVYFAYNRDLSYWFTTSDESLATRITSTRVTAEAQLRHIAKNSNLPESNLRIVTIENEE